MPRFLLCVALTLGLVTHAQAEPAKSVKVTVLSTMLAGNPGAGIGEWGFAAVVDVDGRRLLVDTGARPETVLKNAAELGIDLSDVTDVVLTHNHSDHTGGLLTLRQELSKKNPRALIRAHVGKGIFLPRLDSNGADGNGLLRSRAAFEAVGGAFVEHAGPVEILPAVWLTGPVPRVHPERNWSNVGQVRTGEGLGEDNIPEDTSIVIATQEGLVVVSGCGHAGMINTVEYARKIAGAQPVLAAIGGFHLFAATDETLEWTAARLRDAGLKHLLGVHCTGIEAVYRLRSLLGLSREQVAVGAVGSSFVLGRGIDPLPLAR
jgi:7,8-dihydropterin-6-yl-methyl-4-(beta-D-ribofuranosyl)aminobenzene 5'-phosphate synthase